jgi:type III restriction enzyme
LSSSLELFPFQAQAAEIIAHRFSELSSDPRRPSVHKRWDVPFYQALSALTGAGKTPILADAVTQIRTLLSTEPIVLWISKAKAVVDQTYANCEPGGKYAHLIEGFLVTYLSELTPEIIKAANAPCIALATVGTFNQKDKEDGTLRIHKVDDDKADDSLWTLLRERQTENGQRRPLIIVYDEGHNLSDQQTELLLELEPDAFLMASATLRTSAKLAKLVERLREHSWNDDKLITSVPSKAVVDAGLVKRQIILGGYATVMEAALDDMFDIMKATTAKANQLGAGFQPKAIYVCRTNISQEDGTPDNPSRPFRERSSPPILIWRYLVEKKGVHPSEIAVYCDLKFDRKNHPPPSDFILFSGGDDDFAAFSAGNFRHIIFNLSLQEGWDDPACCFAYIDKSMGSAVQVEQIIGRVLRQPNARHYPDPELNTANFYIRVDDKQIFPQILETVRKKIGAEIPEVKLESYTDNRDRQRMLLNPREVLTIPEIHLDADDAVTPLVKKISGINDYRNDSVNTIGKGELVRAVQVIGDGSKALLERTETKHSNRVTARWIMRRTIQSLYPEVVKTIDWADNRFDAKVEITSIAATVLRSEAEHLVDSYLENCDLTFEEENPYTVGSVLINPNKLEKFEHSLHEGYSDLSPFELPFARAIDSLGVTWVRNPSNGGFSIPLLEKGDKRNFFPDFLIWKDGIIFALDPKGDQLITKEAGIKLLNIRDEKGKERVVVRLITSGRWSDTKTKTSETGFTVWSVSKASKPRGRYYGNVEEAVRASLII